MWPTSAQLYLRSPRLYGTVIWCYQYACLHMVCGLPDLKLAHWTRTHARTKTWDCVLWHHSLNSLWIRNKDHPFSNTLVSMELQPHSPLLIPWNMSTRYSRTALPPKRNLRLLQIVIPRLLGSASSDSSTAKSSIWVKRMPDFFQRWFGTRGQSVWKWIGTSAFHHYLGLRVSKSIFLLLLPIMNRK